MTTGTGLVPGSRPERATLSPLWWELVLIGGVALVVLVSALVLYDDAHRGTTNGLWKSLDMKGWVTGAPDRATNAANLLYFPVIGALVAALPESLFGAVWQRMAYVNVGFGAGVLLLTYVMGLRLFGARGPALFACLAQVSMGFFLLLATINEDIMPGYFWFMAAGACVVVPRRLGGLVIALAAQCVALAWLFHSSLQLPSVGAVIVAILLRTGDVRRAIPQVLLFCAALVPLPLLSALAFDLPWASSFWSGKGVGSGWGGFSLNKVVFMWSGIAQSVVGGQNIGNVAGILTRGGVVKTTLTFTCLAALFVAWLSLGRRQRVLEEWRAAVALFTAAFVLGEGMNLYVQPQDPQMQIQPMSWFPLAAASLFWQSGRLGPRAGTLVRAGLIGGAVALAISNVRIYLPNRHADSIALRNVRTIEALAPPKRTVFLLQGFEPMATWLTVAWGRGATDTPASVGGDRGGFNVIYATSQAIVTPDRSPDDAAYGVVRLIEHALDEGFEVVATDIWAASEDAWVDSFSTISGPEEPRAIRAALHERYTGMVIGKVPGWTELYKITRKRDPVPAS